MKTILSRLFSEITRETETNPRFRKRVEDALNANATSTPTPTEKPRATPRPRNRREHGVLDPYSEIPRGEEFLRSRLASLTVDQLKDIVSEHSLDSSRLALKWKSTDRLVDLIVNTVRARLEKGDAFRIMSETNKDKQPLSKDTMDHVDVEKGTARPGLGAIPSHKITITHGSNRYVFWYLKNASDCRDFDKLKDMDVVKAMHARGVQMGIGKVESFSTKPGNDYHLARITSDEFTIKALR